MRQLTCAYCGKTFNTTYSAKYCEKHRSGYRTGKPFKRTWTTEFEGKLTRRQMAFETNLYSSKVNMSSKVKPKTADDIKADIGRVLDLRVKNYYYRNNVSYDETRQRTIDALWEVYLRRA